MKISEIALPRQLYRGIKSTHPAPEPGSADRTSFGSLNSMLKSKGWGKVGEGMFSSIYARKDKNYIIKVNKRTDIGYQAFVNFCKKTKSPYLPKIMDDKFFEKNGQRYHMYLIEKLYPMPENRPVGHAIISAFSYAEDGFSAKEIMRKMYKHDLDELAAYKGLLQLIIKVARSAPSIVDMHEENLMMRKDGTPVIIDPFYND